MRYIFLDRTLLSSVHDNKTARAVDGNSERQL